VERPEAGSTLYVLSLMLTRTGLLAAYGSAIAGALGAQAISRQRMRQPFSPLGE
jgi:F0F1-type ATP synthase membrane subunit c/vacuolar-type H+-ATPase subunit K